MECLQTSEAYITVKDHKEDFPGNPSFRLINPSKTDVGRISKKILDRINKDLVQKTCVNQWKSDKEVIGWFNNLESRDRCTFIKFDVDNFYPSITLELFNKAIAFAKQHTEIPDWEIEVIMQARKTLLFNNGEPWCKKNNEDDFDVPMGSYDGAEVCELVGAFLLNEISRIMDKKDIGLYRDDGLGVMRNIGRPEIERRKKRIIQVFKLHKLSITVQISPKVATFLDLELNLENGVHRPYRKPDNEPLYINANSNHPPNVLKQIPKGIAKRLSEISSSEEVFKAAVPQYEEALKRSGFEQKLEYVPNQGNTRQRSRKKIYYNPPFSLSVKTNIGKEFLRLLRTHFHRNHKFHKIFNKNNVKFSYSCTRNIASILSSHNKGITRVPPTEVTRECNCVDREQCPMGNKCLSENIVYEGVITERPVGEEKDYRGLSSGIWKKRYAVHKQGINHRKHSKACELTKHVWEIKDRSNTFDIRWKILETVRGRLVGGACKLCTTETMLINEHPDKSRLLNKQSIQKCMHGGQYLLSKYRERTKKSRSNPD